jgi:hypothetical protein
MATFTSSFETEGVGLLLPLAKIDARRGRLLCSVTPIPGQPRQWEEVPENTPIDFGVRFAGGISFDPTIKKLLVIDDGRPLPAIPEGDGRKWQEDMEMQVLIGGRGLFMLSAASSEVGKESINQRRLKAYQRLWKLCPQAQAGQLQESLTRPFELVPTANGDFYGIVWESQRDRWFDRDEASLDHG